MTNPLPDLQVGDVVHGAILGYDPLILAHSPNGYVITVHYEFTGEMSQEDFLSQFRFIDKITRIIDGREVEIWKRS